MGSLLQAASTLGEVEEEVKIPTTIIPTTMIPSTMITPECTAALSDLEYGGCLLIGDASLSMPILRSRCSCSYDDAISKCAGTPQVTDLEKEAEFMGVFCGECGQSAYELLNTSACTLPQAQWPQLNPEEICSSTCHTKVCSTLAHCESWVSHTIVKAQLANLTKMTASCVCN